MPRQAPFTRAHHGRVPVVEAEEHRQPVVDVRVRVEAAIPPADRVAPLHDEGHVVERAREGDAQRAARGGRRGPHQRFLRDVRQADVERDVPLSTFVERFRAEVEQAETAALTA